MQINFISCASLQFITFLFKQLSKIICRFTELELVLDSTKVYKISINDKKVRNYNQRSDFITMVGKVCLINERFYLNKILEVW